MIINKRIVSILMLVVILSSILDVNTIIAGKPEKNPRGKQNAPGQNKEKPAKSKTETSQEQPIETEPTPEPEPITEPIQEPDPQPILEPEPEPITEPTQSLDTNTTASIILNGFSGSVTGISGLNQVIAALNKYNCNAYRISFTPVWTSGTRPYHPEYVDYLLENWDGYIIVDRNHHLQDTMDWEQAEESIFECLERWGNNDRVLIEIVNEYWQSDMWSESQAIIDNIRAAGYTNMIVQNKHASGSYWVKLNDPLDKTWQGKHFYMNNYPYPEAYTHMQNAMNAGINPRLMVNTEVGADYHEHNSFTVETVAQLNEFLEWCNERGIGNMVWLNKNTWNLATYEELGLVIPSG